MPYISCSGDPDDTGSKLTGYYNKIPGGAQLRDLQR